MTLKKMPSLGICSKCRNKFFADVLCKIKVYDSRSKNKKMSGDFDYCTICFDDVFRFLINSVLKKDPR